MLTSSKAAPLPEKKAPKQAKQALPMPPSSAAASRAATSALDASAIPPTSTDVEMKEAFHFPQKRQSTEPAPSAPTAKIARSVDAAAVISRETTIAATMMPTSMLKPPTAENEVFHGIPVSNAAQEWAVATTTTATGATATAAAGAKSTATQVLNSKYGVVDGIETSPEVKQAMEDILAHLKVNVSGPTVEEIVAELKGTSSSSEQILRAALKALEHAKMIRSTDLIRVVKIRCITQLLQQQSLPQQPPPPPPPSPPAPRLLFQTLHPIQKTMPKMS